jgi:hypothetical protein
MFGPHLNLFRPITELARHSSPDARSFPPFFASSFLSLLAKLWDPLVSPILFSCGQSGLKDESEPDAPPRPCLLNLKSPRSYKSCDLPFSLCLSPPCAPLLLLLPHLFLLLPALVSSRAPATAASTTVAVALHRPPPPRCP